MALELEIFAPIDAGATFLKTRDQRNLSEALRTKGWAHKRFSGLSIDPQLTSVNSTYQLSIPAAFLKENELHVVSQRELTVLSATLELQTTGICMLCVTYGISLADDALPLAANAYHILTKSKHPHFARLFSFIISEFDRFLAHDLCSDETSLRRKPTNTNTPHWTHGCYLHKAKSRSSTLHIETIRSLAGGSEASYQYRIVNERTFFDESSITCDPVSVTACFGWETTAISSWETEEVDNVCNLVKQMGHIWEMHYVINALSLNKARSLGSKTNARLIEKVREFRGKSSILLGLNQETQLSMVDRYVHISILLAKQWQLDALRNLTQRNNDLLTLIYQQIDDRQSELGNRRISLLVAALSVITMISVTTDVTLYLKDFGSFGWRDWSSVLRASDWLAVIVVLGWPLVGLSIYGAWTLVKRLTQEN